MIVLEHVHCLTMMITVNAVHMNYLSKTTEVCSKVQVRYKCIKLIVHNSLLKIDTKNSMNFTRCLAILASSSNN